MSAWTRGDTVARLKAQRQPVVDDAAAAAEEAVKDNSKPQEVKQEEEKKATEDTTSTVAAAPVEAAVTESPSVPPQHADASEATAAPPAPTTVQLGPLRLPHDIAALVHPGLYKFVGQLEALKEEATATATHAEPASHNGTTDAAQAVTHHDNDNSNAAAAAEQVREAYAFPQPAMSADDQPIPAADQVEAATTAAAQPSSAPRQRPPRNGGNAGRRTKNGYNHNNNTAAPPQRMRGRQGRFNPLPIAPPATLPLDLHPFGEIPRQYALRRQYAMHATSSAAPHTEGDATLAPPPPPPQPLQPEAPLYYGPSASHFAGLNANAMPYHASPIPYGPDPYSVDPYSHVMMGMPFHPTNRLQLRPPYVPRS